MMKDNGQEKIIVDKSINNIKSIMKTIQETQNSAKLTVFQGILQETIPIVLYSSSTLEPYSAFGMTSNSQTTFRTHFFRIERLENSLVYLSLLFPMNVEGDYIDAQRNSNTYRLEKTKNNVIVSIQDFCSIQCIDPKLVNRTNIIIGDKW